MKEIGLIIMAAGLSTRFGNKNKLLADYNGRQIIDIVLDNIPLSHFKSHVLITMHDEIIKLARQRQINCKINNHPESGVGGTIKLGLDFLGRDYDGYMFLVCDQPSLRRETILNLADFWQKSPNSIASLSHEGILKNPVVFPYALFDELSTLDDSQSGKTVVNNHKDLLKMLEVSNKKEVMDVDTLLDLENLLKD